MKDKEDYGSFEGYEDGAGVYVQYAVANQQGAAKAPPHTSSASNIADLDIVMGSQVCGRPMVAELVVVAVMVLLLLLAMSRVLITYEW